MNVLSLFSGIDGIGLGLERAGMTVVGQVEIDPWCRTILAKHWPEVPRHDDVRTCVEWWRGDNRPAVDLVCGGFPCQPVSVAGKRLAQADDRWLWPAFAQVIRGLRPSYVLVENVPGLLARGMGDVLGDLAGIGYDAEWDCIPAAFVGAPHIRRRVFIVAYPGGEHGWPGGPSGRPASFRRQEGREATDCRPVLADAEGQCGELRTPEGERPWRPASSSPDVADTGSGRHRPPRIFLPAGRHSPLHHRRWPAEPDVGRVAHGIPRRVDRLRGLGNAVVPQVAEHIGRLIMEASAA